MTMIARSIFIEFFIADVTKSGIIISNFVMHGHYHLVWIDILFKCVYKYLYNIIIVKFFYKGYWLLRIECIIKTLYVVTKSTGDVFLILISVALLRI